MSDGEIEVLRLWICRSYSDGRDHFTALIDVKEIPREVVYYVLDHAQRLAGGSGRGLGGLTPVSTYAELQCSVAAEDLPF
jgi:hypothetical protein